MPQVWKVVKAFQSTNRDTGEPDVIKTRGGDMHKFMVQVENQPVDGWLQLLKKTGNKVEKGDELYGDIVENNYGKPQYVRADRPQEMRTGSGQVKSQPSGELEAKVDYLISLVENFLDAQGSKKPAGASNSPKADDDAPADLTSLDF